MKRLAALLTTIVIGAVLAACGSPEAQREKTAADTLFVRSGQGVAILETGSAPKPQFNARSSVTSSDWSTVVTTQIHDGKTDVVAVDPSTGGERWRTTISAEVEAKLLSEEGDLAALGPRRERHYSLGRTETTLVIAGGGMVEPRSMTLEGNYEPEAFSTDGENLFVIKYLPARNPTQYQVRQLDIDKGAVRPVYTPHDELQRPMGGSARVQVASPDGRRLYTLYTVGGNDGYAFIHVLALDDMWAHCIALPREFAKRASRATGLTVSPSGDKVYVANSTADAVAEIDTESLKVTRTNDVDLPLGAINTGQASSETFYFSGRREVAAVDTEDLVERNKWEVDGHISGIQPTAAGDKVYVAIRKHVAVVDAESGEVLEEIDPEGVGFIDDLGTGMRWLDSGIVKCAC